MGHAKNELKHLAIIMDGNGRWARKRGHSRFWGHIRGAKVARTIIEHAAESKIPILSLFAFSSENWGRPKEEVSFLMRLLQKQLSKELVTLKKHNVKFTCIGQIDSLPPSTQKIVHEAIELTKNNTGTQLIFALNYSGRSDIVRATKKITQKIKSGLLESSEITEGLFADHLETAQFSDPDLIIRTSGEVRLSNFMLWQAAYSELHFSNSYWPDFTVRELNQAIAHYQKTQRRFGKVTPTSITPTPNTP